VRHCQGLADHAPPPPGSVVLNAAECELAVLVTQCLDRRLPDLAAVAREVAAWEQRRNQERATAKWHFTTAQARRKLRHSSRTRCNQRGSRLVCDAGLLAVAERLLMAGIVRKLRGFMPSSQSARRSKCLEDRMNL
jgi:hypothetical protein